MSGPEKPRPRRRWLRWFFVGLLFAVLGSIVGLALVLRSTWLRESLRNEAVTWLNREFQGSFEITRVEGSLWHDLILSGITIRNGDDIVLQADALRANFRLDPRALLDGRFDFASVELDRPTLHMREGSDGKLDIATVFDDREPDPDDGDGPKLIFSFTDVRLHQADVRLALRGSPAWRLHQADARASVEVLDTKVRVALHELVGKLIAPGDIEADISGELGFDETESPTRIEIHQLTLQDGASQIDVEGLLRDASGHFDNLDVLGTLQLQPLAGATLTRWVPELRSDADVRGTVKLAGGLDDLGVQARLHLADGRADLDGIVDLQAPGIPFSATLHTHAIGLERLTAVAKTRGRLSGRAAAAGRFDALPQTSGSLDIQLETASAYDRPIGDLEVQAQVTPAHVAANASLHGAYGSALLRGDLHRDTSQRFAAELLLDDVDAALVPLETALPHTRLDAQATIEGEGFTLAELRGKATLAVQESDIAGVRLDDAHVDLVVADGGVQVHRFEAHARGSSLTATGEIALLPDAPMTLSVALSVPRIDPWNTSRRISGRGSVEVTADLSGSLAEPRLQAQANVTKLSLEDVSFKRGSMTARLARHKSGWLDGEVSAQVTGLKTPLALDSLSAELQLSANAEQSIQLTTKAIEPNGRSHLLRASGNHNDSRSEVTLQEFVSELPWGTWTLVEPAVVVRQGERLEVQSATFVNGEQRLEAGGILARSGPIAFSLRASSFTLENLAPVIPALGQLEGALSGSAVFAGTAAMPTIDISGELTGLRVDDAERGSARLEASYREGEARVAARYDQDELHYLVARAAVPVSWRLDAPTSFTSTGSLSGRVESEALRLDILSTLLQPHVEDFDGLLHAAIDLSGTLDRPRAFGKVGLEANGFKLAQVGVRVKTLSADVLLDDRHLVLEAMRATARDGELTMRGQADLDIDGPTALDVTLTARDWPPIWTKRYQALVGGELRFSGTLLQPSLTGKMRVEQAFLKPDLRFLDRSAEVKERDATIRVIDSTQPTIDTPETPPAPRIPPLFDRLATDVVLEVQRNTRVKHEMADIELRGSVRIRKQAEEKPVVIGSIEAVRGWVEIQGRQFKIQRGEVVFTGGRVENPRLDVVAVHRKSPYEIEARLGGTVEAPTLVLSSNPSLEQADILAVLLFGRPTSELDEGEKTTMQERAIGLTSGYAAGVLGKAVSEALGLENLGVDMRNLDLTGGRVGIGRYLLPDLYISVTQGLGEDQGREVSAEYFLTRRWKIITSSDSLGTSGIDLIWETPY